MRRHARQPAVQRVGGACSAPAAAEGRPCLCSQRRARHAACGRPAAATSRQQRALVQDEAAAAAALRGRRLPTTAPQHAAQHNTVRRRTHPPVLCCLPARTRAGAASCCVRWLGSSSTRSTTCRCGWVRRGGADKREVAWNACAPDMRPARPHRQRPRLASAHGAANHHRPAPSSPPSHPHPPSARPAWQDRERGVVWEETIIFLEHSTKMVRRGGVWLVVVFFLGGGARRFRGLGVEGWGWGWGCIFLEH